MAGAPTPVQRSDVPAGASDRLIREVEQHGTANFVPPTRTTGGEIPRALLRKPTDDAGGQK
jgi:hypothetical protein